MQITDKVVLITGGGGGIGGGMAQAFAEKGARIVLADIDADFARQEAARLPSDVEVEVMSLDVTSLESWDRVRQQAEARFGPVDVLCNNAGVTSPFQPLIDMEPAEFDRLIGVNVRGVFNGIRTFARSMAARGSGHVVNTASVNGLLAHPGSAAYSASKFAVTGLSDALREELAPAGIGVSTLFPGLTRSRMSETSMNRLAETEPDRAAQMRERMLEPIVLGRSVVRAVEDNEPYILTHPEFEPHFAARMQALMAAFRH